MYVRLIFVILLCLFFPIPTEANDSQGEIGAAIIDPRQMTFPELKKFCKQEPQTIACEIYEERVIDTVQKKQHAYPVLTASYQ